MNNDVREALESPVNTSESGEVSARFVFGADLPLFSGHFPDDPILPGVLQVEMVRAVLEASTGSQHRIVGVRSAKFKRKVIPGEMIDVALSSKVDGDDIRVRATLTVGDEVAAVVSLVAARINESGK